MGNKTSNKNNAITRNSWKTSEDYKICYSAYNQSFSNLWIFFISFVFTMTGIRLPQGINSLIFKELFSVLKNRNVFNANISQNHQNFQVVSNKISLTAPSNLDCQNRISMYGFLPKIFCLKKRKNIKRA